MNPKLDEVALRKKNRSLTVLLSRARGERDDALIIAAEAVNAVKEVRNGKEPEAVKALEAAVRAADALAVTLERIAAAAPASDAARPSEGGAVDGPERKTEGGA